MGSIENIRAVSSESSVDRWLEEKQYDDKPAKRVNPLDSRESKRRHTKLLEWFHQERERQSPNRYQMALDHDFYDNLQWADEDIQELLARGQAPLVFNEIAPTVDWIVGTEKRTRVDFKVLPRTDDDVKLADAKTKVLKWLSDINKTGFKRSLAFADAVKGGLGWLEDGVRGDPDDEPIYSRYESWKNMIHDSFGVERDLSDARYLFRVKWIDLDIACALFPNRKSELERSAVGSDVFGNEEDEDFWYIGQHYQARDEQGQVLGRRVFLADSALVYNRRSRVRMIECWYRHPERCHVMKGEIFDGERYNKKNAHHRQAVEDGACMLHDSVKMLMRCAVMTEGHLMQDMPTPYKHNKFPFTPIWCYRRSRDGQPYGVPRRIRDPQEDLNKRASKALFLLSTNRVIVDANAFDDHDEAREEAARPDAYLIKNKGSEVTFDSNVALAEEHLTLMDRDGRLIRQAGGVTDDNLGRATNAISGEAIKARQLQGSVVTAEIFDNLRLAIQLQGEIQLSLAEQWLTQPKVVRLVQSRGELDWVRINQPEEGPDGVVRYVNDITASQADFIVDQQDFAQSTRQAMFDTMVELVSRIATVNAEAALRILKMALEFSDLPNKDEMAGEIAAILGLDDEDKDPAEMTPEERAKWEQKQAAKAEAAKRAQMAADLQLRGQAAVVDKTEAQAGQSRALGGKAEAETLMIMAELRTGMENLAQQVTDLSAAIMGKQDSAVVQPPKRAKSKK